MSCHTKSSNLLKQKTGFKSFWILWTSLFLFESHENFLLVDYQKSKQNQKSDMGYELL